MPKKTKPEPYNSVTAKQIEEWTSSFDLLLASERGRDLFREHLLLAGTERHLAFWQRCQQHGRRYRELRQDASDIYETYLDIDAPEKVNVFADAEAARVKLEQKGDEFGVFEEAQYRVKARMEQDSYPGFCEQLRKMKKSLK